MRGNPAKTICLLYGKRRLIVTNSEPIGDEIDRPPPVNPPWGRVE